MIKLKEMLIIESEKTQCKKMSHQTVMYVTPEVIDQGNGKKPGCHCGKCAFFNKETSECILTKPAKCNAEHGVCGLFLGKPKTGNISNHTYGLISKDAAGYIEDSKNIPSRCGNCEYYSENKGTPSCAKVKAPIYKDGCCNKWEPK